MVIGLVVVNALVCGGGWDCGGVLGIVGKEHGGRV